MITPQILAKYDRPVPRYTSYPTAPHFGPQVDAGRYGRWLAALDPDEPVSLYLHVPFCDTLCWFCGCHTRIVRRYDPVAGYLDALRREIDLVADAVPGRLPVRHIHFGGGSPTMVAPDDFRRLMDHLGRRFRILADAEIAIEVDPRGLEREAVLALAEAGVTRASIGVQDFNPAVQRAVHRIQSLEETARVVGMLRGAGVEAINMDLMYGLPLQTVAGVADTVTKALAIAPDRVAVFGYAHVPWMKTHQKLIKESDLPGHAERWRQYAAAAERLAAGGYVAVGLDHFARPDDPLARAATGGRLHRNFQGYTTDQATALIGLGASAIGTLPQGYVQNVVPIDAYVETVRDGRFPVVRGIEVDDDDRLRREVIERLMCDMTVDLAALARRRGRAPDIFAPEIAALKALEDDGIVEVAGERVTVTEDGRPLVRTVCAVFDRYLGTGEARHSRAV